MAVGGASRFAIWNCSIDEGRVSKLRIDRNFARTKGSIGTNTTFALIGGDVKTDEQEQVRSKQRTAKNASKLLSCTSAIVGHPRKVGRGEVSGTISFSTCQMAIRVCCKVSKHEGDDELDDLDSCDPFLPPDSDATSGLEEVPIHDHMDSQVEDDRNIALLIVRREIKRGIYNRGTAD